MFFFAFTKNTIWVVGEIQFRKTRSIYTTHSYNGGATTQSIYFIKVLHFIRLRFHREKSRFDIDHVYIIGAASEKECEDRVSERERRKEKRIIKLYTKNYDKALEPWTGISNTLIDVADKKRLEL